MALRPAVGLVVAAAAGALGALLLGEYDFSGWLPWFAGPVMGGVLAELAAEIGRRRSWVVGVVAGSFAAAGLLWAAWISTGEGLSPLPGAVWPAMGLAVLAATAWLWAPSPVAVTPEEPPRPE